MNSGLAFKIRIIGILALADTSLQQAGSLPKRICVTGEVLLVNLYHMPLRNTNKSRKPNTL
jgi:hypothetical protein